MTSYEEACEWEVTREEAMREIFKHFTNNEFVQYGAAGYEVRSAWETFLEEVGDKETYEGKEVLDWLGY